jgi:hypothetical protein
MTVEPTAEQAASAVLTYCQESFPDSYTGLVATDDPGSFVVYRVHSAPTYDPHSAADRDGGEVSCLTLMPA